MVEINSIKSSVFFLILADTTPQFMLEISGKRQDKSDEELLEEFQRSGSLDVLGELYARYMHLVYGVSLKYFGDRGYGIFWQEVC